MDIYEKAKQIIYKHYNVGGANVHPIYKDAAYDCVVAAIQQTIDESCKWLEKNADRYLYMTVDDSLRCSGKMTEDLKKAMEE